MLRLAAAAGLLLFLAGCTAPPPTADDPTAQPAAAVLPPASLDWAMADCQAMTWSVPVLSSSLQRHLPSGFEPSPGPEAPAAVPVGADQAGTLGFRAVECSTGLGQTDILRSVQMGALFTPVIPPRELRDDRFAGRSEYGWDVLIASEPWRLAAAGWSLPVHDGGAMVGPSAQGWTGALAMDRVGSFTMTGRTVDGDRPASDHERRTITAGREGFALWDAAIEDVRVSTGAGVWSASAESWVAELLGATSGLGTFELAHWSMPSATVHWPGQTLGPLEDDAGPGLGGVSWPPGRPADR